MPLDASTSKQTRPESFLHQLIPHHDPSTEFRNRSGIRQLGDTVDNRLQGTGDKIESLARLATRIKAK